MRSLQEIQFRTYFIGKFRVTGSSLSGMKSVASHVSDSKSDALKSAVRINIDTIGSIDYVIGPSLIH